MFDITTSYVGDNRTVGITRVEQNLARYISKNYGNIVFCHYRINGGYFVEIPKDRLNKILYDADIKTRNLNPSDEISLNKVKPFRKPLLARIKTHVFLYLQNYRNIILLLRTLKTFVLSLHNLLKVLFISIYKLIIYVFIVFEKFLLLIFLFKKDSKKIKFNENDIYISVGMDWDHKKKIQKIFRIKKKFNFRVVLMCYDIIPVKYPNYFPAGFTEKFLDNLSDKVDCADKIIAISKKSEEDLKEYIVSQKKQLPSLDSFVLGSEIDFFEKRTPPMSAGFLNTASFILYVSTIEGRKNHQLLYNIWVKMTETMPYDRIPFLIFAGKKGWLVDDLLYTISTDLRVNKKIKVINGLNDCELSWLYDNCLFTVFPSFYEGWGLPVMESIAHGKLCLCSMGGALMEVAPGFVEYLDSFDTPAWLKKILFYLDNPDKIAEFEKKIISFDKRLSWSESGRMFLDKVLQDP